MSLLVLSPTLLIKCHHSSSIFKSLHWLTINERSLYKVLSYIKLLCLVILHIFILFLVLNAIVLRARLLWSHLIALLIIVASKSQIGLFILLLLLCGAVRLASLFISLCFLLNLISIHLHFLFLIVSF
jgi:hypothetical protein